MATAPYYPCAQESRVIGRAKRDPPPNHLGLDFHIYMYIYVCTFLIHLRVLVICDRNSTATKNGKNFRPGL